MGNDARFYVERGNAWRGKRAFKRAMADFNHAIILDPKLASAYAGRGSVESDQGNLDAAITDFTRAIKLDQKIVAAYLDRAHVEKAKGDLVRFHLRPGSLS